MGSVATGSQGLASAERKERSAAASTWLNSCTLTANLCLRRGVAQFGSALALGARCRRFESCLPDAIKNQSPAGVKTVPQGAVFYCSPCSSKLLERASHYAVAPEIPSSPPSSRSQTWTTAISTDSTLTWPPTSRQRPELKLRLLSHPRICNKLNSLSQSA